MKKISLLLLLIFALDSINVSAQDLSPYFKVTDFHDTMENAVATVKEAITSGGFEVIGDYNPAEKPGLEVICFTNEELKNLSLQFKDRGALASVMRVGLVSENGKITVSILNPEYMFLAYWGEQLNGQQGQLNSMSEKVKNIFLEMGTLTPFGGTVSAKDLPGYHYMMMMPYFDEPVELKTFTSFEEGLKTINENLEANKGNTIKVFELVFKEKEIAVFGIGLENPETGEAAFLPTVGEGHIANLPYEIILQGKEATMLHGKYRIALFWPELKMGTFMKISSTPGDIEDTMKLVVGKE